jgi:hypothetical protein
MVGNLQRLAQRKLAQWALAHAAGPGTGLAR